MQSKFPNKNINYEKEHASLAYYYPYDAVKDGNLLDDLWRNNSYSPEILDFKEWRSGAPAVFLDEMCNLIRNVYEEIADNRKVILVPVPSGVSKSSPHYGKDKKKNYENRNEEFCEMIVNKLGDNNFEFCELLSRTNIKRRSKNSNHKIENDLIYNNNLPTPTPDYIFLFDDVYTSGNTINACKKVITANQPINIFSFSIGCSKSPHEFNQFQNIVNK